MRTFFSGRKCRKCTGNHRLIFLRFLWTFSTYFVVFFHTKTLVISLFRSFVRSFTRSFVLSLSGRSNQHVACFIPFSLENVLILHLRFRPQFLSLLYVLTKYVKCMEQLKTEVFRFLVYMLPKPGQPSILGATYLTFVFLPMILFVRFSAVILFKC